MKVDWRLLVGMVMVVIAMVVVVVVVVVFLGCHGFWGASNDAVVSVTSKIGKQGDRSRRS